MSGTWVIETVASSWASKMRWSSPTDCWQTGPGGDRAHPRSGASRLPAGRAGRGLSLLQRGVTEHFRDLAVADGDELAVRRRLVVLTGRVTHLNEGNEAVARLTDVEQLGGDAISEEASHERLGVLTIAARTLAVRFARAMPTHLRVERFRRSVDVAASEGVPRAADEGDVGHGHARSLPPSCAPA